MSKNTTRQQSRYVYNNTQRTDGYEIHYIYWVIVSTTCNMEKDLETNIKIVL